MSSYEDEYKNESDCDSEKINYIIMIVAAIFMVISSIICLDTYNQIVDADEKVNLAQANVQAMIQRRLELIPDLVSTAQAAAEHEEIIASEFANAHAVLNSSTEALRRTLENGSTILELDNVNSRLSTAIKDVLIIIEKYPTITASEQYSTLMVQLEEAANRITVARELYNVAVFKYNKLVRQFPGKPIASHYGFERIEPFKADEEANNSSLVNFN